MGKLSDVIEVSVKTEETDTYFQANKFETPESIAAYFKQQIERVFQTPEFLSEPQGSGSKISILKTHLMTLMNILIEKGVIVAPANPLEEQFKVQRSSEDPYKIDIIPLTEEAREILFRMKYGI